MESRPKTKLILRVFMQSAAKKPIDLNRVQANTRRSQDYFDPPYIKRMF